MQNDRLLKPKCVLMTADTIGGVWTYALELSRGLAQHSVEVVLGAMGRPLTQAQRQEAREVPNLQLQESRYKLEWMDNPWDDVARAGDWLLGLEQCFRPDLVHLNSYSFGALPWRAPALLAGHSCVLSWWRAVKGTSVPPEWARYYEEVHRGLQLAGKVVAPSRAMLKALEQHYGSIPNGVVAPNGRDPAAFKPQRKEPFILAVGRLWDEAKNLAALQSVAPFLSWPVCVAGDNCHPDGGAVSTGNVCFLGTLPSTELASWYGRAAIYALPAWYEPFGLSALEAALAGCALALGDIPSLRETWDGAALFVPPDDTDALRVALQALASDRRNRTVLAAHARHRALQYTPARMAEGYLQVYAEMLTARRTSALVRAG
jgi:glycogen synthase